MQHQYLRHQFCLYSHLKAPNYYKHDRHYKYCLVTTVAELSVCYFRGKRF
jgi:hypothetical protein